MLVLLLLIKGIDYQNMQKQKKTNISNFNTRCDMSKCMKYPNVHANICKYVYFFRILILMKAFKKL